MPTTVKYRLTRGDKCGYVDPSVYVVQRWYPDMRIWADVTDPHPLDRARELYSRLLRGVIA